MEYHPGRMNENENKILAFKDFTKVMLGFILVFSFLPYILIENVPKFLIPKKFRWYGAYKDDEVFLWACKRGNQNLIQECFDKPEEEKSIIITARDSEERNGLHLACLKGHLKIVETLINKKMFNPLTCDKNEESILHLACRLVRKKLSYKGFYWDCNG